MRVKALIDFFDIEKQEMRKAGSEFSISAARAEKLIRLRYVETVDPPEKKVK